MMTMKSVLAHRPSRLPARPSYVFERPSTASVWPALAQQPTPSQSSSSQAAPRHWQGRRWGFRPGSKFSRPWQHSKTSTAKTRCADTTSSHRAGGATAVLEPIDARVAQCKNCHNLSAEHFLNSTAWIIMISTAVVNYYIKLLSETLDINPRFVLQFVVYCRLYYSLYQSSFCCYTK